MLQLKNCDDMVTQFQEVLKNPRLDVKGELFTGVDIGTAYIVVAVVDENRKPVAGAYEYADVVKDGMIVNFMGAVDIVRRLKDEVESKINRELIYAAAAIPPGTAILDAGSVRNVVESAGFLLTALPDEPTAANKLLKIENGVVVDIGGGTTGVSVLQNGEVVHVFDEATGGTHFTLVLAGSEKIPFKEAEEMKKKEELQDVIYPLLVPVIDKVSTIILKGIKEYKVEDIILVGGSACLKGIEKRIETNTSIKTSKPMNPFFTTPLGIALCCTDKELERN